jgi:nicotinamidase/pyrazinamidase
MVNEDRDRPALLIVDMLKDNFDERKNLPITPLAKKIINPINDLISVFRNEDWPVVFPADAFHEDDFIFKGRMKPHSLAGTEGAEIIDDLDHKDEDLWLPKPVFSAFFKTDLDKWLRERDITLCAVAGIATNFCVLTTVMDAISHGFKAVLLEDCSAALDKNIHQQILAVYRRSPLYPLFRVMTSSEFVADLTGKGKAGVVTK